MKTCKFCGQEINVDDKFCPFCGAEINEDTTDKLNQDQPNEATNQTNKTKNVSDAQPTNEQSTPATESEQPSTNLSEQDSNIESSKANNSMPNSKPKFSGFSIAGFVVALVGLFLFAIVSGIVGVIMSAFALKETKQNIKRGRGLAIAGLVISIIDIISFFLLI